MATDLDLTPQAARAAASAGSDPRAVFGRAMALVGATCAFAALGAYAGRDLGALPSIVPWIAAFVCLLAMGAAADDGRRSRATALLFATGLLIGLATGATIVAEAQREPATVWEAACATGLTVAAMGAFGYATRRDLSALRRTLFVALLGLIVAAVVLVLVQIPGAELFWALAGIAVFSGYAIVDFNRLRRADKHGVVSLAAGIFLDVLNLFLFFLSLFGNN